MLPYMDAAFIFTKLTVIKNMSTDAMTFKKKILAMAVVMKIMPHT